MILENFQESKNIKKSFCFYHGESTIVISNHLKDKNHEQRKQLPNISASKPNKNLVFIVDESIRGAHRALMVILEKQLYSFKIY
jgi:hypothetical protein